MRILCPHNPKDRMILVEGQEYIIDLGRRPGRGGWGTVAVYLGNNTFRKSPAKWDDPSAPQPEEMKMSARSIRARVTEYKPLWVDKDGIRHEGHFKFSEEKQ